MAYIEIDEFILSPRVQALDLQKALLFDAICCRRLFPVWEAYLSQAEPPDHDLLAVSMENALTYIVQATISNRIPDQDVPLTTIDQNLAYLETLGDSSDLIYGAAQCLLATRYTLQALQMGSIDLMVIAPANILGLLDFVAQTTRISLSSLYEPEYAELNTALSELEALPMTEPKITGIIAKYGNSVAITSQVLHGLGFAARVLSD